MEAWAPVFAVVAMGMLGSEALEEKPCSEAAWKVLEWAGDARESCGCHAEGQPRARQGV